MTKLQRNLDAYEPLHERGEDIPTQEGAYKQDTGFDILTHKEREKQSERDDHAAPVTSGMAFARSAPFVKAVPMGLGFAYFFVPPPEAGVLGWNEPIHLGDDDGTGAGMGQIEQQAAMLVQQLNAELVTYKAEHSVDGEQGRVMQEGPHEKQPEFVHDNGAFDARGEYYVHISGAEPKELVESYQEGMERGDELVERMEELSNEFSHAERIKTSSYEDRHDHGVPIIAMFDDAVKDRAEVSAGARSIEGMEVVVMHEDGLHHGPKPAPE